FFVKYFKDAEEYDFTVQLNRMAVFCILNSLSEWSALENHGDRVSYVKSIFNDPFTVNAMKHIGQMKVPLKKKVLLYIIKFKCAGLYLKIFAR
ncbi:MAG: hypothetical protein IJZ90_01400, partial [Clostridia bacterium]|nr:hypothetical protein [Clostridia bacterium]